MDANVLAALLTDCLREQLELMSGQPTPNLTHKNKKVSFFLSLLRSV